MKSKTRLERLVRRFGDVQGSAGPLTLFLVAGPPGQAETRRSCLGGVALEITFDPELGWPEFPPGGPHKLVYGPEFDV